MERELPPYRRTFAHRSRSSVWTILAVGALLAIAITAGAQLLSATRARWEARYASPVAAPIPVPTAPTAAEAMLDQRREQKLAEIRKARDQRAQKAAETQTLQRPAGQYRCINGQLFRKLPNGWENLPGEHCASP